jgi:hypothetical protein
MEFLFVLIGFIIGIAFAKKINAVIAALGTTFLLRMLSSEESPFKSVVLNNYRVVCVYQGNVYRYLLSTINPGNIKAFLPTILNFYSNEYENPNCAPTSGVTYFVKIIYLPSDSMFYVIQGASFSSMVFFGGDC